MPDTEKEEKIKRVVNAIDDEKNKVSYLVNQNDNDAKLEFLKNFTDKESRDKIISSLEHKVSPDLFRIVYLAQRMIKEFLKDVYTEVPVEKSEVVDIIFNRTNVILNKIENEQDIIIDTKERTITISEKVRHGQGKLLGYVLLGYAHSFINRDEVEENEDKVLEDGNSDIFVDLVVNNYIKKHPYENLGFHIDKNYSVESKNLEEDSIIRTRMYVLEKLKIDRKMLLEYIFGDKEKYKQNIFNGGNKEDEFNLREFYEKNKFALTDMDRDNIYYRKNSILPLYILQQKMKEEDILDREYTASEIIKKYFKELKINRIDADEFDKLLSIIQDTNKIKDDIEDWLIKELENLTDMEKRVMSANIIENILVVLKYKKINNYIAKQVLEVIKYLINDLEREVEIERGKEVLQKINNYSAKIEVEDKELEEEVKDSLSYLKIKLEMANESNLTPETFFNRLQGSLKSGSKIERNEELIAYQTIKDELNLSKK